MFQKKKLEAARKTLHNCLSGEPRANGCTIASGFLKKGWSFRSAYVNVKKLGATMLEDLGSKGFWEFEYRRDKTLRMVLVFSWGQGDGMYELIKEIFYEGDEGLFDDYDDEDLVYKDMTLVNVTDTNTTEIVYEAYNVTLEALKTRVERMIGHVVNKLDILYEEAQEEFGEGDSYDEE